MAHNATSYYVSFQADRSLGAILLNYTVYINIASIGDPMGIFLNIAGSPIIQNIVGFDNGMRTKDYVGTVPPTYSMAENIATFEESILYRDQVSESLFVGDTASFDFRLSTVVVGSSSSSTPEDEVTVFVTVTRTPGKGCRQNKLCFIMIKFCFSADPCDNSPCLNGGTCTTLNNAFSCECTDGLSGVQCETDLDFCTPDSCLNGGTCFEGLGTLVFCACAPGYTGDGCEIDIDVCITNPCLNNGTCIDNIGPSFECSCTFGFTGTLCELVMSVCTPDTCKNGGTCSEGLDTSASVSCSCAPGFIGDGCEVGRYSTYMSWYVVANLELLDKNLLCMCVHH